MPHRVRISRVLGVLPVLASGLVMFVLAGCGATRPSPIGPVGPAPELPADPSTATLVSELAMAPVAVQSEKDRLPLSIQRIVREQQAEVNDVAVLAAPVGDARGRERAAHEVGVLADTLRGIEEGLRAGNASSDRLDEVVVELKRLQTRIALLHDALRVAGGPSAAVEKE